MCRTKDVSTRSSGNNGFPRPQGSLIGAISPKILFIPLIFPDTPAFADADLLLIQDTLKEVQDFYRKTSYGLVNIEYQILEKSKWITLDRSAQSYGLTNPRPQQNNTEVLKEILAKADPSINFDLYDGVTIETVRFSGQGVGQAFLGQVFPTRNGSAKGVSLETAMAAGSFQTIAHELGHTLFGLEDLYVFLNDQRPSVPGGPNPAGSWDMMSSLSATTFFGWRKYLNGWLGESDTDCVTNQDSITQYLGELDSPNAGKKMILLKTAPGVLIAAEVRSATCNFKSCMGLLLYKIDTNFHHGEGPIVAEKLLLYTGENLVVGKHRFTVEDFDNNGLLVKVEKML